MSSILQSEMLRMATADRPASDSLLNGIRVEGYS